MIVEVSSDQVIEQCATDLGLSASTEGLDDTFLAAAIRRAAGVLCPCSKKALVGAVVESFAHLHERGNQLSDRIEELTEDLLVVGDLLELTDVATADIEAKGTWVFCSPPAFIERRSGGVFVTGIVPDHDSVLPQKLGTRVVHQQTIRFIEPAPSESLSTLLEAEGFNHLSESAWLKIPRTETAEKHLEAALSKLAKEPLCGPSPNLEIIDAEKPVSYYRGRWSSPASHTGTYVARRPHEFRSPTWCFAELNDGMLNRLIDLPLRTNRWRGCDAAWQLQMAIDYERGEPQRFRVSSSGDICRLEFFSPLPLWAERRLMVLGSKCKGTKCLFAYELPVSEAVQEIDFLERNLWLMADDELDNGGAD